jgi:hypothetical protein
VQAKFENFSKFFLGTICPGIGRCAERAARRQPACAPARWSPHKPNATLRHRSLRGAPNRIARADARSTRAGPARCVVAVTDCKRHAAGRPQNAKNAAREPVSCTFAALPTDALHHIFGWLRNVDEPAVCPQAMTRTGTQRT